MNEIYERYKTLNADYKRIRELPDKVVKIVTAAGTFRISNKEVVERVIDLLIKETNDRMKGEIEK